MKYTDAIHVLETCEQNLRKLVADAAGEGDYTTVQRIADLARAVAALAGEGRDLETRGGTAGSGAQTAASAKTVSGKGVASTAAPGTTGTKGRPAPDAYPKFFRRGEELVKVGWSKKDRREYNHRAPRRAVDAVAVALRHIGAKGAMFTGDKLLPLHDPADGARIADYQAYVALAWLKNLGIVAQHGRKSGYTLVPEKQIDSTVTTGWAELAQWRG